MARHSPLPVVIACSLLAGLPSILWGQLQSVDEATQKSQATGRPIFAMAGNKT